ncbi:MAG: 50S ribosomal protein L17 [Bacteroidota bacterium]
MRHRKAFNHLSRKAPHRKAMLANMAASLIKRKRITTTTAKAKALRSYIEPLITKSKNDTTHSRRVVFSYLQDKDAVSELFREVSPKIMERPGGYTRILKLDQNRLGDNAELAMIELVDFNPNLVTETQEKEGGTRRRRRGGKKKTTSESKEMTAEAKEETTGVDKEGSGAEGQNQEKAEASKAEQEKPDLAEKEDREVKAEEKKAEETAPQAETEKKDSGEEKQPKARQSSEENTEEKPAEEEKKNNPKEDRKES